MSTDRELLELAARAARIEYRSHNSTTVTGIGATGMPHLAGWNPLTDDGDALRLAAALELDVMHRVVGGRRIEVLAAGGPLIKHEYNGDVAAAMRRAIVIAAAEIGRRLA